MPYYLVVFIRKMNLLCFTSNVFLSNSYRTQAGSFVPIYFFRSSHQKYFFLKNGVLKNFAKFLRTLFLQDTSEQLLLFLLSSHNLLTGQQKTDLCCIKRSFQIYQLSFSNKKLIEVFVYILN